MRKRRCCSWCWPEDQGKEYQIALMTTLLLEPVSILSPVWLKCGCANSVTTAWGPTSLSSTLFAALKSRTRHWIIHFEPFQGFEPRKKIKRLLPHLRLSRVVFFYIISELSKQFRTQNLTQGLFLPQKMFTIDAEAFLYHITIVKKWLEIKRKTHPRDTEGERKSREGNYQYNQCCRDEAVPSLCQGNWSFSLNLDLSGAQSLPIIH